MKGAAHNKGRRLHTVRDQTILRLWECDGHSYGEIARQLGCTRSVVAGVVGRYGKRLPDEERLARRAEGLLASANNRRKP